MHLPRQNHHGYYNKHLNGSELEQEIMMGITVIGILRDRADHFEKLYKEISKKPQEPHLGCATTKELLDEIRARIETDGRLEYKTIDS